MGLQTKSPVSRCLASWMQSCVSQTLGNWRNKSLVVHWSLLFITWYRYRLFYLTPVTRTDTLHRFLLAIISEKLVTASDTRTQCHRENGELGGEIDHSSHGVLHELPSKTDPGKNRGKHRKTWLLKLESSSPFCPPEKASRWLGSLSLCRWFADPFFHDLPLISASEWGGRERE